MAEQSSFFNAVITNGVPDRIYKAEIFARFFSSFIGNGVFPNPATGLQVVATDNNMTVKVKAGKAWINGYYYENSDDLILKIDNADGVLHRIDSIVLRLDFINREIKSYVKKGSFSSSPVAPSLVRDTSMYELCIANIRINAGSLSINQSNLTDTRLNSQVCGIVAGTIEEIDTTELYRQLQEAITEKGLDMDTWLKEAKDYFSNWLQTTQTEFGDEFNTWFDGIKGILDGDAVGNILNLINNNTSRIDEVDSIAQEALQSGVNVKAGMKNAINSKITIPDVNDEDNWTTYIQRVKDIKEGRGNAKPGDVLAGKTFTNDSGQMSTGTIPNRGGAQTITPGTTNKVLNAGYYSGNITIAGDSDLNEKNIRKGVNVFNVIGTLIEGVPGGKKKAKGTIPMNTSINITNLGFKPSTIIMVEDTTNYPDYIVHSTDFKFTVRFTISNRYLVQEDIVITNAGFTCPFISNYSAINWIAYE